MKKAFPKNRKTRGRDLRKTFTLIELLMVTGIIAVLAGMLLPALKNARTRARAIQCASNLKNVLTYHQFYVDDHAGYTMDEGAPAPWQPTAALWWIDYVNILYLRRNTSSAEAGLSLFPKFSLCPSFAGSNARKHSYATNINTRSRKITSFRRPPSGLYWTMEYSCNTAPAQWPGAAHAASPAQYVPGVGRYCTAVQKYTMPEDESFYMHGRHGLNIAMGFADGHADASHSPLRVKEARSKEPKSWDIQ